MIQADPDNDPDPGCRGFEHAKAKAGKGRQAKAGRKEEAGSSNCTFPGTRNMLSCLTTRVRSTNST